MADEKMQDVIDFDDINYGEQPAVTDTVDEHLLDHMGWLESRNNELMNDIMDIGSSDISKLSPVELLNLKKEVDGIFNQVNSINKEAKKAIAEVDVPSLKGVGFDVYQKMTQDYSDSYEKFYSEWFKVHQKVKDTLQPYINQYDEKRTQLTKQEIVPETPLENVMENTEEVLKTATGSAILDALTVGSALTNPTEILLEAVTEQDKIEMAGENIKSSFDAIMDEAEVIFSSEEELKQSLKKVKDEPHNIRTRSEMNEIKESALANNESAHEVSHVSMFFKEFCASVKADFAQSKVAQFFTARKEFLNELQKKHMFEAKIKDSLGNLQESIKFSNYFQTQANKIKKVRDIEIKRNIRPLEKAFDRARKEAALGSPIVAYDKNGKKIGEPLFDGKPLPFPYKSAVEWAESKEGKEYIDLKCDRKAQKSAMNIKQAKERYEEDAKSPNTYLFTIKEAASERVAQAMLYMDKNKDYTYLPDLEGSARELRLPGYTEKVPPAVDKAVTDYIRERNALERTVDKNDPVEKAKAEARLETSLNKKLDALGDEFGDALRTRLKTLRLIEERERLEKVKNNRGVAEKKKTIERTAKEETEQDFEKRER